MAKFPIVSEPPPSNGGEECRRGPSLTILNGGKEVPAKQFMGRAAVITLGCAKNHVDSEVMLGILYQRGFEIVSDVREADVAIVNTCGFLQSAVQESIDCILDISDLKKEGRLRKLIVAGCAVQRYQDPDGKHRSMKEALPEVDEFVSVNELLKVGDAALLSDQTPFGDVLRQAGRPYFLYDDSMPRILATKRHMAYVKISEGCNRPCTFCIIPSIRGPMRSRTLDSVEREVRALSEQGVREINLVAQDSTSYGLDLKDEGPGRKLAALLKRLNAQQAADWIRLLYAYPVGMDEELLDVLSGSERICEYLDIPLQHVSESVLQRMKRPLGRYAPRAMTEFIRGRAPSLAIRTTFIVGFPGETEEDIRELETFVRAGHFSSVGVFTYSPEEGSPSAVMDGAISEEEKSERRERIMLAQQDVSQQRSSTLVGKVFPVLIEGFHEETELLLTGRTRFQAPEVDGLVIVNELGDFVEQNGAIDGLIGSIVNVKISEVAGYDLVGGLEQGEQI